MKRAGHLMERIVERENLLEAWRKASRRKRGRAEVEAFGERLEENLEEIGIALESGDYRLAGYRSFPVFDPKERTIRVAPFRERVMQHAVMNVCEGVFERYQIADSYACRKGKGLDACLRRTVEYCGRWGWHAQCDVRKYFDRVPHEGLKRALGRRFKDGGVLRYFGAVIDGYETEAGRGIPIGNLTSQHFANLYLGALDHEVKDEWGVKGYVRYMDDFALFGGRAEVKEWGERAERYCAEELGLELKGVKRNRNAAGMRFLGFVARGSGLRLTREAKRRYRAGVAAAGRTEDAVRAQALTAWTERAASRGWRRGVIYGSGDRRDEPREPRRGLEQQRPQLPQREPGQERARLPEQQPGVPGPARPKLKEEADAHV